MNLNENLFFEIKSLGNFLKIEVLNLVNENSELDWDNNWINCKIYVSGGAFSGNYSAEIMTFEFEKFKHDLNSLYENLNGTAEFQEIENYIIVKVKGDGIGHFNAEIICFDYPGIDSAKLEFEIYFDQTFIKEIVNQLNQITKEFPITGDFKIQNNYNVN